jgi:hypothetical protein
MVRIIFTWVVPFVVPAIGWYVWVRFFNKPRSPEVTGWSKAPWAWLAVAGAAAVVAVLLVTAPPGADPGQVYEPAHIEDGKVVPGQYRQREGQ